MNLKKPTKGFTKTNRTKKTSLEFPTILNDFFIFGATQALLALEKREKITHVGSKENCIYFVPSGALVFWVSLIFLQYPFNLFLFPTELLQSSLLALSLVDQAPLGPAPKSLQLNQDPTLHLISLSANRRHLECRLTSKCEISADFSIISTTFTT